MTDLRHVETLLQDAIALLEESGFPIAAETLRDNLRKTRTAPTAATRSAIAARSRRSRRFSRSVLSRKALTRRFSAFRCRA